MLVGAFVPLEEGDKLQRAGEEQGVGGHRHESKIVIDVCVEQGVEAADKRRITVDAGLQQPDDQRDVKWQGAQQRLLAVDFRDGQQNERNCHQHIERDVVFCGFCHGCYWRAMMSSARRRLWAMTEADE